MGPHVFEPIAFAVRREAARSDEPLPLQHQCEKLQQRRVGRIRLVGRIGQREKEVLGGQLQRPLRILVGLPRLEQLRPPAEHKARGAIIHVFRRQQVVALDLVGDRTDQVADHPLALRKRAAGNPRDRRQRL